MPKKLKSWAYFTLILGILTSTACQTTAREQDKFGVKKLAPKRSLQSQKKSPSSTKFASYDLGSSDARIIKRGQKERFGGSFDLE